MAHLPALSIGAAFLDLLRRTASSAALLQRGTRKGKMSAVDKDYFFFFEVFQADSIFKNLLFFF